MKKLVMALSVVGLLTGPAFILSGPALAHEPGTYESAIVEQRVKRFKQSGADIQSVFKQHIPSKNFGAIEAAAMRIAIWASQMPDAFPEGSTSVGAAIRCGKTSPISKPRLKQMKRRHEI